MYDPDVTDTKETLEYGAYVKIVNDPRYPPLTSPTNGQTFNHYAQLTKSVNSLPGLDFALSDNDNQHVVQKYGYNYDIDASTDAYKHAIWTVGGEYPYDTLSTPRALSVSSAGGDDGVQVQIQGLNSDWDEVVETVTLQGDTSLPGLWRRVYRASVTGSVESTNDIRITIDDTSEVVAEILTEEQQTLMALYTVPRGYTAFLTNFESSISRNEDMLLRLRIREPGGVFKTKHLAQVYATTYRYNYDVYKPVFEMCDVELTATPVNNNVACHAAFDMVLLRNQT